MLQAKFKAFHTSDPTYLNIHPLAFGNCTESFLQLEPSLTIQHFQHLSIEAKKRHCLHFVIFRALSSASQAKTF